METTAKKQNKISEKQLLSLREKRKELKSLSTPLLQLVKDGIIETVNQGLASMYAEQGHTSLNTIRQWNKKGMKVKKGEHALLLWGQPKKINKEQLEKNEESAESNNLDFFPLCFVFSSNQVEERRN